MRACAVANTMLISLTLLGVVSCDGKQNRPTQEESYGEKQERFHKALVDLASANNAIIDWQPKIDDLSLYSIDVERAMIRAEPIGFIGRLSDVIRLSKKHLIIFEYSVGMRKILFRLQAEPQQVESILKLRPSQFDDIVVIAKIDAVRSADLRLVHHGLSAGDDDSNIEAEIESSNTVLVADGRYVAIMALPDTAVMQEKASK